MDFPGGESSISFDKRGYDPRVTRVFRCRDANFPDAGIVRSEERGSHGPRAGPGGVQEQRHFGGPGEMSLYILCYRADVQKILQKT